MFDECLSFDIELELQFSSDVSTKISKTFNFKDEVICCVNFMGELYNYRILTDTIAASCISDIAKALDNKKAYMIDVYCNFIKSIAKRYVGENGNSLEESMSFLNDVKGGDMTSMKDKCVIMDLIDFMYKNKYSQIKN
jgi:hypothetical protein